MNQINSTYTDLLLQRTETLIRNWSAYISGDKEIQEAYPLDYLSTNLIEQIQRINRLKLSNEKVDELCLSYRSLFENNKFTLISSAIKGAEPISLLSLFENTVNNIHWALEKDGDSDSEFEIYDQLSDCLVKRDDLFLVENYVRKFLNDFSNEENKTIQDLFDQMLKSLLKIDKSFKDNIEVFTLTEKFCRNYTASNRLFDEEIYWWFYEPIHKCEEIGIVSLMTLKQFFVGKETKDETKDLSSSLNANVQFTRLMLEEKNTAQEHENILHFPESTVHEPQAEPAYALAAKSGIETNLRNAVYVLVINTVTKQSEHYHLTGSLKIDQEDLSGFSEETKKEISKIPKVAKAFSIIDRKVFSIDLHNTAKTCTGQSIGLPGFIEFMNQVGRITITKPIAATGSIQIDGKIQRVGDINTKVRYAITKGFEIILIPKENEKELEQDLKDNPAIRFVSNVVDALNQIQLISQPDHPAVESLTRLIPLIKQNKIDTSSIELDEKGWNYFIKVAGLGEERRINVYFNSKNQIKPPKIIGNDTTQLYKLLSDIINNTEKDGSNPTTPNLFAKGKMLDPEKGKRLQDQLRRNFSNYLQEIKEQGCDYRFDITKNDKVVVKQFLSGTITANGRKSSTWSEIIQLMEFVLEQKLEITESEKKDNSKNIEHDILPANVSTWIGVDEAGKGDYFGPLVTAAVLIDESNKKTLSSLGIKDSKNLSDQKNIELGTSIAKICGDKCYVLATMPERYNQLLSSSFNGNSQNLLGWQHRRAMENILEKHECQWAICDQFGNESFINEGLKTGKGSQITIIQRPKAESNIAVAAASILARREFLLRLQKMSEEYKVTFPKGSSDTKAIITVAGTLIKRYGKDILNKVAKTHFKTTKMILEKLTEK